MGRLFKQLTERDRVLISHLKSKGFSISEVARRLGKNKSTISRELRRNAKHVSAEDKMFWYSVTHLLSHDQLRDHLKNLSPSEMERFQPTSFWSATEAQANRNYRLHVANQLRRRKRLDTRKWVLSRLREHWSPEQIAGRSKTHSPEPVSHEYVYLLVKADKKRGGKLHRLLKRYRKRKQRFNVRNYPKGPIIPNRTSIEDRPKIVAARSRLGDLEGDLIQGYKHSGFVLSVVDRKSKYLILRKLRTKRKTTVRKALQTSIKRWKCPFTLTLDNGSEFCEHEVLTQHTNTPVYFTHPYCSTERGTIENTNGLVRHFLPKKTPFSNLTQRQLNKIQTLLNRRPRKCLNFLTPEEVHLKKQKSPPKRMLHL
jgi:IS30 family transposase